MSKLLEKLHAFLKSEEGQASMDKFVQEMMFKDELDQHHANRMKKMFSDQESFDSLMYKIIAKHDDAYVDSCYKKGYEPHPKQIMYAMFNLANTEGVECEGVDPFTTNWPTDIVEYMGWKFAITHGQGSVSSIYKGNELIYRD
jgi:hypothetical protein